MGVIQKAPFVIVDGMNTEAILDIDVMRNYNISIHAGTNKIQVGVAGKWELPKAWGCRATSRQTIDRHAVRRIKVKMTGAEEENVCLIAPSSAVTAVVADEAIAEIHKDSTLEIICANPHPFPGVIRKGQLVCEAFSHQEEDEVA